MGLRGNILTLGEGVRNGSGSLTFLSLSKLGSRYVVYFNILPSDDHVDRLSCCWLVEEVYKLDPTDCCSGRTVDILIMSHMPLLLFLVGPE